MMTTMMMMMMMMMMIMMMMLTQVTDLIMSLPKYSDTGFRPTFEAGAHARPHLFIGGAMNTFASPDDPIFWLHHTFVDKIWAMWQVRV
jgi:hypothetical protein